MNENDREHTYSNNNDDGVNDDDDDDDYDDYEDDGFSEIRIQYTNTKTTIKYGAAQIMEIGVCYSDMVVTPSVFCVCHGYRIVLHMYVFRATQFPSFWSVSKAEKAEKSCQGNAKSLRISNRLKKMYYYIPWQKFGGFTT